MILYKVSSSKAGGLLRQTVIYGITSSLQNVLGFILLPIITNYLAPDEFGVYSILLLLSSFVSAVFYFGGSSALGRFYFEENHPDYKRNAISTAFYITISGLILLIAVSIIFSKSLSVGMFGTPGYHKAIILAFSATGLGFLANCLTLIIRYENKPYVFFGVTIISLISNFSVTYYCLDYLQEGILSPFIGLLVGNGLICIGLIHLQRRSLFNLSTTKYLKGFLRFGFLSSINGLLFLFMDWIDRLILKDLMSLSDVGIYSLGYRFGALINIVLVVPFALIWAPFRMEQRSMSNFKSFVGRVASYYTLTGTVIICFAIFFGPFLIKILFQNQAYYGATKIFPLIMLGQLLFGYQNILDFGIYLHQKLQYYIIISSCCILLNIILNYALIPDLGPTGAAIATIITYFSSSFLIYLAGNKFYRLHLEWKRIFFAYAFLSLAYILANTDNGQWSFFINGLFILSAPFLAYKFWLDKSERMKAASYFKKISIKNVASYLSKG